MRCSEPGELPEATEFQSCATKQFRLRYDRCTETSRSLIEAYRATREADDRGASLAVIHLVHHRRGQEELDLGRAYSQGNVNSFVACAVVQWTVVNIAGRSAEEFR